MKEEANKKITYDKNILSSTKLSLIFNNTLLVILDNKNNNDECIQENIDPLTKLISNFAEITELWNIKKIKEENIIKLFYFNKNKVHKILYKDEEILDVKPVELKKPLLFCFYLNLLIKDNINIVNYSYSITFIKMINETNKKITNKDYEKIIISKIIIDLINNYKKTENYNEEMEEKVINTIVEENKLTIKNNQLFPNIVNELLNIDEIYIEKIINLINDKKFDNYEEIIKIISELDLENINITKIMFKKLSEILNENKYYILNSYEDLYNEKKINFYYILLKYILKEPFYIYNIDILLKNRKLILNLLKSKKLSLIQNYDTNISEKLKYIIIQFADSKYYFINRNNTKNSVENNQSNSGKSSKETNSVIKSSEIINSKNNEIENINVLDNNNENNNLDNRIGNNNSLAISNNRNQVNGDNSSILNGQSHTLFSNSRNEYNPKEISNEDSSFNAQNEDSFNCIPNIIEGDIGKFITMSTYTLVINDNNNERNKDLNKFYKDYKDYINKIDENNLENERKILYDNFRQFIKFIDKVEEKSHSISNFNVEIDLNFGEQKEKGNGRFKNINCEYKIKSIDLNIIDHKLKIEDKDILNNDENDKNITNFNSIIKKLNIVILSLSSFKKESGNSSNSTQRMNYIINSLSTPSEQSIIDFIGIIGNHGTSANYIKELKNGLLISGGSNKLIIYNEYYDFQIEILMKNHNIFEINNDKNSKNESEIVVCSDEEDSIKILNINSSSYKIINQDSKIKSRICFNFNKDYIICNKNGIFQINDLFSTITASNEIEILKKSYWNGIKINSKIIALTSNKNEENGEDKIIFFNYYSKRIVTSIENYSFTLSQNNLDMIPREENDKSNKILLCACKKYKDEQKNGILLVTLDLKKNLEVLSKKFYESKNFEVYCFCPISKFYNIKDIKVIEKKNNKMIETEYFLVGGFNLDSMKGVIKLYKIKYNNQEFKNTEIEYIKDIEIKSNIGGNKFDEFRGKITCIIQSRYSGNILVTCSDGNVFLFTFPNIDFY